MTILDEINIYTISYITLTCAVNWCVEGEYCGVVVAQGAAPPGVYVQGSYCV
jgi:hypothetical protein